MSTNFTVFDWTFDTTFGDGQPASAAVEPADLLFDLLTGAEQYNLWTLADPTVEHWEDRAESERGPGDDQPAELYTWQPTRTPRDRFSADGTLMVETPTAEAWVYALDRDDVATYARDAIDIVEQYMDNQYDQTDYGDIVPSGIEDFREAKVARRSAHYVYAVEVEFERLDATGP